MRQAASRHLPAIFVAEAPGLDFLNSVATPRDTPVDWLADGNSCVEWLRQAGLVPPDALRHLTRDAEAGELDALAGRMRHLREWFRGFVLRHKGRPLTAEALAELEPLNTLLRQDAGFSRIVAGSAPGEPLHLEAARRWGAPDTLLLPVADALARLVCTEPFTHVKACEGAGCTLLFADHTKGHTRRWCSMTVCGNRAKQAAHRQRRAVDRRAQGGSL